MKDQIQFETNGLTVLAVKWPKDASDLVLPKVGIADLYFHRDGNYEPEESYLSVGLPQGNWKLHAVTDSITEEQAKVLCPCMLEDDYDQYDWVQSYEVWYGGHDTAKAGLDEYLRSHGIDPNEKYILLIKSKE